MRPLAPHRDAECVVTPMGAGYDHEGWLSGDDGFDDRNERCLVSPHQQSIISRADAAWRSTKSFEEAAHDSAVRLYFQCRSYNWETYLVCCPSCVATGMHRPRHGILDRLE